MQNNEKLKEELTVVLSSTYSLLIKTQNFHWNVEGAGFYSLHKLFEEQYQNLSKAVDKIAERLRALNFRAPGSMSEFLKHSLMSENQKSTPTANMLKELIESHCIIEDFLRSSLKNIKEDPVTEDLLIERLSFHENSLWFLRMESKKN